MEKLSRRKFLETAGLATGGTLLTGCLDKSNPYSLEKPPLPDGEVWARGEEKRIASVCGQCHAGCGIQVRVVEGRAVKIVGLPGCPLNRGTVGPKGQSGLQLLYHPDRIKRPLKRDGERGSGKWKPVKWEEAITEIGAKLKELRSSGEARGMVVLDGEPRGMIPLLWSRFLEAYGSPNHVNHRSATDFGQDLAMGLMTGSFETPGYDWDQIRYVFGLGGGLLESWCQTIHFVRTASRMRRGLPGQRAKFVLASSRFSVTASKADEWLPIEPATYGALVLGIAHVLIKENLYDQAFVKEHTFGFDPWKDDKGQEHRGFRDLVLKDYPPEKVASVTGVPAEEIQNLAREMAASKPAVVLADGEATAATNGLSTAMAILALNALLGSIERPGGLRIAPRAPLAPLPDLALDPIAKKGKNEPRIDGAGTATCPLSLSSIQTLPEAILSGKPYEAGALFLCHSNPVFSKPDGKKWTQAIQKVPLVVSFSSLPDESTLWADYVLPDHTYLERWELVEPAPSSGYSAVGLRKPVVTPLHDTRPVGEVILDLARAVGGTVAAAFPWKDYRSVVIERLKGLVNAPGGSIKARDIGDFVDELEGKGWWTSANAPYEQWNTAFHTPSGKFEFFSQGISRRLADVFPDEASLEKYLDGAGISARGDDVCLPHWEPPRFSGTAEEYPLRLIPYRGMQYAEGGTRHIPWLLEMPVNRRLAWKQRIELNPEDAKAAGVKNGDLVFVESSAGNGRFTVHTDEGIQPGTAGLPLGYGHWPPTASQNGATEANGLIANVIDPLAGTLALQGTRVRIKKEQA